MPNHPSLETDRLRLRPFTMDDLETYHNAIYSDPDVMRFLPSGRPVPIARTSMALARFREHWRDHGFGLWAVIDRATGALMGHTGLLMLEETPEVEVAYAFGKAHWGHGYATEAARASLTFGFETLGLNHIIAIALPENARSRRVMEKLGMTEEGPAFHYGLSVVRYSITRERFALASAAHCT